MAKTKTKTGFKAGSEKPEDSGIKSHVKRSSYDVIAERRASGKPLPLEVMLAAMDEELNDPNNDIKDDKGNVIGSRRNRAAYKFALDAATYFHAKPQATLNLPGDPLTAAEEIRKAVQEMDATMPTVAGVVGHA